MNAKTFFFCGHVQNVISYEMFLKRLQTENLCVIMSLQSKLNELPDGVN